MNLLRILNLQSVVNLVQEGPLGTLKRFARIRRFARVGPSKNTTKVTLGLAGRNSLSGQCEKPAHTAQQLSEIASQWGIACVLPCFLCGIAEVSLLYGWFRWAKSAPITGVQRTRSTLASHSAVPCGTNVK